MDSVPPFQENLPDGLSPSPDFHLDWLDNAEKAVSRSDAFNHLSTVTGIESIDLETDLRIHHLLRRLQKEDPHLTYMAENDQAYQLLTIERTPFQVRKNRRSIQQFSAKWPLLLRLSYLGLGLAVAGFLLAGLGTLVCAPLAVIAALAANLKYHSREISFHSLALVMLSGGVWLIGLLISVIFLLHLV